MGILRFHSAAVVLVVCRFPAPIDAASVEFNRDVRPIGESHGDPALDAGRLAAYASVCSLLLNLDGAITKD